MSDLINSLITQELDARTQRMFDAYKEKEKIEKQLADATKRHRMCAADVAELIGAAGKTTMRHDGIKYTVAENGLLLEDDSGRDRDSSLIPTAYP